MKVAELKLDKTSIGFYDDFTSSNKLENDRSLENALSLMLSSQILVK